MKDPNHATGLLRRLGAGDRSAADELLPLLYDELHHLARGYMRQQRPDHTLQPTALVNEAWLRLADPRDEEWQSREHFLAVAATAMRSVLVDHARSRAAEKRTGSSGRVSLEQAVDLYEERAVDLLALDGALDRLATLSARSARIVELRFFGGMTAEEVARVLGVSLRTVEREWRRARAWLGQAIGEGGAARPVP